MNRRMRHGERGIGKLTLIVFGSITAALVWLGFQVLPFYYYYYELRNHFESVIRVASTETDNEIRRKLMYHIKKMQLPVDPEQLRIERDEDTMTIQLKYTEVLWINWKGEPWDLHRFHFDATVTKRFR